MFKNKNNIENNKSKKNIRIINDNLRGEYTYFKLIINKIKKKNKYFKYFIINYRFNNNNIFYKNANPLIKE